MPNQNNGFVGSVRRSWPPTRCKQDCRGAHALRNGGAGQVLSKDSYNKRLKRNVVLDDIGGTARTAAWPALRPFVPLRDAAKALISRVVRRRRVTAASVQERQLAAESG